MTVIFEDRMGTLWIGTDGGGLDKFDRRHQLRSGKGLASDDFRDDLYYRLNGFPIKLPP